MNTLHPNHKWIICERDSSTTDSSTLDSSTLDNSTLVSSTIERSTHWLIKSKLLCCSFSKLRTESDLWEHFPLTSVHTAHLCIRDICHFVDTSTIFNQNIWHQKTRQIRVSNNKKHETRANSWFFTPGWKLWHLHCMWCMWQISGMHMCVIFSSCLVRV